MLKWYGIIWLGCFTGFMGTFFAEFGDGEGFIKSFVTRFLYEVLLGILLYVCHCRLLVKGKLYVLLIAYEKSDRGTFSVWNTVRLICNDFSVK